MTLLTVTQLHFGYPGRNLFSGISFSIEPGLTWIRGENGSGKSTLLRLIGGATLASISDLRCSGASLKTEPIRYKQRVFWMGPDSPPFDHLNATQFWHFLAGLYPSSDLTPMHSLSASLGFEPYVNSPMRVLSTGNQRKAWLIAALLMNCPVTLLDEPFNALDSRSQGFLQMYLASKANDLSRAWVLTSHTISAELDELAKKITLPL